LATHRAEQTLWVALLDNQMCPGAFRRFDRTATSKQGGRDTGGPHQPDRLRPSRTAGWTAIRSSV